MALELTVTLGELVTAVTFVATGIAAVLTIRSNVSTLAATVKLNDKQNEFRFSRIDAQIEDFKLEMKKLGEVLIELTKANGRQDITDERMLAQGKRIDSIASTVRDILKKMGGIRSGRY